MLTNISWSNYIIAISISLLIWYLILIFWFYPIEVRQLFFGERKLKIFGFGNYTKSLFLQEKKIPQSAFLPSSDTLEDVEQLSISVLNAIQESAERDVSKEELKNYLRLLLVEYPFVKSSILREEIIKLIVFETSKHQQHILTYQEADCLWEEVLL